MKDTPFHQPLPVTVYLRSRKLAVITAILAEEDSGGFPLHGHILPVAGEPEAWRANGRWSLLPKNTPLDIIGEVVGYDAATGKFDHISPYAPAAGAKDGVP